MIDSLTNILDRMNVLKSMNHTIGNDSDGHDDHDPDHDSSQITQKNDEDQTQHHSDQQTNCMKKQIKSPSQQMWHIYIYFFKLLKKPLVILYK